MPSSSSSSASSSSSHGSLYFTAILSPSSRENPHGKEDTPMESSSSSAEEAASSSSSSSSFQSSSLNPSSITTRENTHHHEPVRFREEYIHMISSASSSSCISCSSSQSSSSNPSPSTEENTHKLFISFRGEDTRRGFVSYLHEALGRNGIRAYMDDRDIRRGNEISSTLLMAIEKSKISLIVFSKNYASSSWTLNELVKIMDCQETRGQLVLPIFYEISPSEIRKKRSYPTGGFMFRLSMKETEQRWATAMKKAAGLAGWESSNYRTESELVEVIVNEVKNQLESMNHTSDEGLSSSRNCSPDEPNNSGGSSLHVDDPPPEDSSTSPKKCLSNSAMNLLGYILWRKEHERLILKNRRPDQPSNLNTSRTFVVHRNRYLLKQEQRWWGTQQEHIQ